MATWDFEGQVVLITGGTGGLGYALCEAYTHYGARVYACGFDQASAEGTVTATAAGQVKNVDIRKVAELERWIAEIIDKEGRADVLVNAAGICPMIDIADVTEDN